MFVLVEGLAEVDAMNHVASSRVLRKGIVRTSVGRRLRVPRKKLVHVGIGTVFGPVLVVWRPETTIEVTDAGVDRLCSALQRMVTRQDRALLAQQKRKEAPCKAPPPCKGTASKGASLHGGPLARGLPRKGPPC